MSTSIPLRQLSGLSNAPAAISESALVLIDAQNTYRAGVMALTGVDEALDECARILDRARSQNRPIIHIQHDAGSGSPYDLGKPIGAIVDRVAPRNGERVIVKKYPNSFLGTELDSVLKGVSAKNLLLVGFMTHMCVNSTARDGFNRGFSITIPGSATATRPLPALNGNTVSAEALQAASLAALADLFAVVVPTVADIPD
jgi:nicotinamidase-related amidase